MDWISLTIVSAVLLGFYDAAKKHAVSENAVPAVLMATVTCGALIWGTALILGRFVPVFGGSFIDIAPLSLRQHGLIAVKSIVVGTSWTLAYFSLKTLPLSIASPLRATGPIWTIFLAVVVLSERPTALQWIGVLTVMSAMLAFSVVGRREGIDFGRHRGVWWMFAATIVGSISGLYDKFLLHIVGLPVATVQAWFTIDLVGVMTPAFIYWWNRDRRTTPFQFRRSIPAIAILLLAADYAYFTAVAMPQSKIAIISPVRRLALVVSLALAFAIYREKQGVAKFACTRSSCWASR